jgi:hypothetical protein
MKITNSPTVYPAANRCIYCGATDVELRREHVIPFGLGGNIIFPRSSCKECERITGAFEQFCLRSMMGNFRVRYDFPTRKSKKNGAYGVY